MVAPTISFVWFISEQVNFIHKHIKGGITPAFRRYSSLISKVTFFVYRLSRICWSLSE